MLYVLLGHSIRMSAPKGTSIICPFVWRKRKFRACSVSSRSQHPARCWAGVRPVVFPASSAVLCLPHSDPQVCPGFEFLPRLLGTSTQTNSSSRLGNTQCAWLVARLFLPQSLPSALRRWGSQGTGKLQVAHVPSWFLSPGSLAPESMLCNWPVCSPDC